MTPDRVLAVGPNGGAMVYSSVRAAARALSGTGGEGPRAAITNRAYEGGGFVGNVYVQFTNHPGGISRPSVW